MTGRPSDASLEARLAATIDELVGLFRGWEGDIWPEDRFGSLALRVFALQFEGNLPYRRWCLARGAGPDRVRSWREIPPVPTAAFRAVDLAVGDPAEAPLLFRTSGTTRGAAVRGRHPVVAPELYRASLLGAFRRFVLGEAAGPRVLTLVPAPSAVPDSSLGFMLEEIRSRLGDPGSRCVADADGIRWDDLEDSLREASSDGAPVCLLGTTLSLSAWAGRLEAADLRHRLPPGSVLMDTGGSKGSAGLDRRTLFERLLPRVELGPRDVVNEFGMTELLSQRYGCGIDDPAPLLHGPPWLRTAALDPLTLAPLPDGEEGILCHWDLANAGSVVAVLTEDRGRVDGNALTWLGRTSGAPPRGCSLATAELLEAQARG
jgi:hypothetical protein